MITEPQPHAIVLHLTDAHYAQLQPYLEALDITAIPQTAWADEEISAQGHVASYANVEQHTQHLIMCGEIYAVLVERVGSALDYDVRWQPNEHEPDGFIERIRPLELISGTHTPTHSSQCDTYILANRAESRARGIRQSR